MTTSADQAAFYPDVLAEGSLAGFLQTAGVTSGVSVLVRCWEVSVIKRLKVKVKS
jgi:hypothetical protein